MSSLHYARHRTSPPSSRKIAVKALRPAAPSASKVSLKGNGKTKQSTEKAKENPGTDPDEDEDYEEDMATFDQFWQILVPKSSLLYCSERCKHIDAAHVSSFRSYLPVDIPASGDNNDTDTVASKHRGPVERAQPTPHPILSARIPPKAHEGKSDLDPTEWKPKLPHRPNSDASRFLGQFHHTPPRSFSPRRPAAVHAQTMSSVPMTAPSLSATPSASSPSSSGDSEAGTPYYFVDRPLMRRLKDPMYSNSAAIKSPDLVIPKVPSAYSVPIKPNGDNKLTIEVTAPAAAVSENMAMVSDLSYQKNWDLAHSHGSMGSGTLTTLLGSAGLARKAAM
ncbi:MAG: hypothetical protein Q9184_004026 [Pyrenodesmia sp. 2 TL-2023]